MEDGPYNLDSFRDINDAGELKRIAGHFSERSNQLAACLERVERELAHRSREISQQNILLEDSLRLLHEAQEEAEAGARTKSNFLANMNHEIRMPMSAIIGLGRLALNTDLSDKQRNYIVKIVDAGTSLLGILNDILDFAKIESGKLEIEASDFDLDQVIESVSEVVGHIASDKELELVFDLPPEVPGALIGDALRLGRILTNLVDNAFKFTECGEVLVRVEQVVRKDQRVNLKFSVKDTGIGMSAAQCRRLFHAYTKADGPATREYGGTGLGLTISRHLVELMGGTIAVDSAPGRGSTFSFTAWFGLGKVLRSRRLPEPSRGQRILVADDNSAAREILATHCQGLGFVVDEASSGAQAVTAVREAAVGGRPYALVLMDWVMPGMSGLQTARAIKGDPAIAPAPAVVMVTAFGHEDVRSEAEDLVLEGFLAKPVRSSALFNILVRLFDGSADAGMPGPGTGPRQRPLEGLRGLRVLLVEDNPINQQIGVEMMAGEGIVVEVANDGRAAVAKLKAGDRYDVVLMDLQMPVMDGYEAAAAIRSDPAMQTLPIVAMTAHVMAEERRRCLDAGMNEHLAKPLDPDVLFDTLARWGAMRPISAPGSMVPQAEAPSSAAADAAGTAPFALDGFDTASALRRTGGNLMLYRRLLTMFVADQADAALDLRSALEAGDRVTAQRIAHSTKGVAALIGATQVADIAVRLENGMNNSQEYELLMDRFAVCLSAAITTIRQAMPFEPVLDAAGQEDSAVSSKELLQRLMQYLSSSDGDSLSYFAKHRSRMALLLGPDAGAVEQDINSFAFDTALERLSKIESHLKLDPGNQ
jgi:two-component system sensor histidine kinase/response regulator